MIAEFLKTIKNILCSKPTQRFDSSDLSDYSVSDYSSSSGNDYNSDSSDISSSDDYSSDLDD